MVSVRRVSAILVDFFCGGGERLVSRGGGLSGKRVNRVEILYPPPSRRCAPYSKYKKIASAHKLARQPSFAARIVSPIECVKY